jgi:hypothetical protein
LLRLSACTRRLHLVTDISWRCPRVGRGIVSTLHSGVFERWCACTARRCACTARGPARPHGCPGQSIACTPNFCITSCIHRAPNRRADVWGIRNGPAAGTSAQCVACFVYLLNCAESRVTGRLALQTLPLVEHMTTPWKYSTRGTVRVCRGQREWQAVHRSGRCTQSLVY